MSREYYVINRQTGSILNCIMTSKPMQDIDLKAMFPMWKDKDLYLDPNPSMGKLMKYQYWHERP